MRLDSSRIVRNVICLVSLLALASTPIAAQRGIDLLDPEQVLPAGTERVEARGGASTARIRVVDPPEGVTQATHGTTEYQYDDNDFENFEEDNLTRLLSFEYEYAQRFDLERSGDLVSLTVCFLRPATDRGSDVFYDLHFYDDDDGEPGRQDPLSYDVTASIRHPGQRACTTVSGVLAGKPLRRGAIWVGISWQSNTNKILGIDSYTVEDERPVDSRGRYDDATEVRYRERDELGDWSEWLDDRTNSDFTVKAYGIRIVVDHRPHTPDPGPTPPDPGPTPDPTPSPEDSVPPGPLTFPPTGPGYTDCIPTVSRLVFDGDYRVSLCYETPTGTKGEANAGIYKSSKSGLLWFFDNENAEVLIKVLDGCKETGHRWVFMAAATDLAFNLYVTDGKSQTWAYHNMQGQPAVTQANNMALKCTP